MEAITAKKKNSYIILGILILVFLGNFAIFGPKTYVDSDQYISMHIHREPLYPLFLAALRALFGDGWMIAMGILQNMFAAVSIWMFAEYFEKKFLLLLWQKAVVLALQLLPHVVTPLFSNTHLILTNGVMTEGLSMPLFTCLFVTCFEMLTADEWGTVRKQAVISWIIVTLLTLLRGQTMALLPVWLIVLGTKMISRKKALRRMIFNLTGIIIIVGMTFVFRSVAIRTYNYAVHGYFIGNTNGTVHLLTNAIYASDRADGENITDEEAREWFFKIYDAADAQNANYKYAGRTILEKVEHIEICHDIINFYVIEEPLRQYYFANIGSEYIEQELWSDEIAGKIIAGIMPKCIGQWLSNYFALIIVGLIRNVAVVHPFINWITVVLYGYVICIFAYEIISAIRKRKKVENQGWFIGLSLLIILANTSAVSIIINPISRYMIYGFPLFWNSVFLGTITIVRRWKIRRKVLIK